MNTTKGKGFKRMGATKNSFGFIVPFLNGASWLSCFLRHYMPILECNPDSKMILVEGATSFHSSAEHRLGLSVDNSRDIVEALKIPQLVHIRRGKVGTLSELLSEGYIHCNSQNYIVPICVSDFISEEVFHSIDSDADLIFINKEELVGDFGHKLDPVYNNKPLFAFRNIEGLSFKHNDMIPYLDDIRLDEIDDDKVAWCNCCEMAISLSHVENQYQFLRRTSRMEKYEKWYCRDIDRSANFEKPQRMEGELYPGYLPPILKIHEWYNKKAGEIWNCPTVFPCFGKNFQEMVEMNREAEVKEILEIGCATGQTLLYYEKRGWKAIGIDPSLWASGYGRNILGVDTRVGVPQDFSFPKGKFSVIAFWDSFEHIPDPDETLLHIADWLSDDGKLIIYTPDYKKFCTEKDHWLWSPQQHFFLYTSDSLRKLLESVGFRIISTDRKIDLNGFLVVAQKGNG